MRNTFIRRHVALISEKEPGYTTLIKAGKHFITADEPEDVGGNVYLCKAKNFCMDRVCILITIAFCSLFYGSDAQSVDTLFVTAARAKLQRAATYTLNVARMMPADNYTYKPSPGEMTFGQQLIHLSRNLGWLSGHFLGNKQANPVSDADLKLKEKDSIIVVVNRTYNYALAILKEFPPGHLTDTVSFFAGPMNKLQIINLLNDHQTHHRGQLIVYLRMNGIKPPAYIGW